MFKRLRKCVELPMHPSGGDRLRIGGRPVSGNRRQYHSRDSYHFLEAHRILLFQGAKKIAND